MHFNINTFLLGKTIYHYAKIDSTQKEILRRIKQKQIQDGTIIIADIQTEAVGTHGRKWYTDKSNNIAFSLFLKTECNVQKLEGITIEIAKIITQIFNNIYDIKLDIKKPNDIMYKNKKIGGILTQTHLQKENAKYIIVGIGINTNQEEFAKEIQKKATSIKKEFNIDVDNNLVITKFCEKFEKIIIEKNIKILK